jgi:transcription factor C subunit 6
VHDNEHAPLATPWRHRCTSPTITSLSTADSWSAQPFLQHKVFQLDYSRATGTFRMLERMLPAELPERAPRGKGSGKAPPPPVQSASAWPAQVGVTRVAWQAGGGLAAAGLLGSATAAGLCRIDWLAGRWFKEWVAYGGVDKARLEEGAAEGEDEPEDEPEEW